MDKQIFTKGDHVYDYAFGWGDVIVSGDEAVHVHFGDDVVIMEPEFALRTLSFTEYTLNNFSQERPIDYNDYLGKWGMFWSFDSKIKCTGVLTGYNDGKVLHPFVMRSKSYANFKPLTEEQIKILELE